MEVSRNPLSRPSHTTTQYVTFIAHRADHLPLEAIAQALEALKARGWVQEEQAVLKISKELPPEMYRFRGRQLQKVNHRRDADIVLFDPIPQDHDLAGMVDGIVNPNGKSVVLSFKEV